MPLETPPYKWRNGRTILALAMTLVLGFLLFAQVVQLVSAGNAAPEASRLTMNFHMHSVVFSNSASVFIYNGADTNPPSHATPVTVPVTCSSSSSEFQQFLPQSYQASFGDTDLWFGGVSWITQPLDEDLTIRGNASMTIWMSASNANVAQSGYVFGISESDGIGNIVGETVHEYYYGTGSVFASTPSPYWLTFNVDRTFARGNIIAFFAGVWSSTKGWQYQVYFDSPATNSYAELPLASVPVPEFTQMGVLVSVSFAAFSSYMLIRRRSCMSLSSR